MRPDDVREPGSRVPSCEDARERILEADSAELRGEGGGVLARHVVACADCRARAERVLAAERALDATLDATVAARARPVEEVLRRVRAEVGAKDETASAGSSGEAPRAGAGAVGRDDARPGGPKALGRPTRWKVMVPLAAAALAAGLALWPRGPSGAPGTAPIWTAPPGATAPGGVVAGGPASATMPAGTEELHVAADRRFALMKTGDPSISVVWFY